jgi:prefoldin subunit 5
VTVEEALRSVNDAREVLKKRRAELQAELAKIDAALGTEKLVYTIQGIGSIGTLQAQQGLLNQ